jgi:hypothetical protein
MRVRGNFFSRGSLEVLVLSSTLTGTKIYLKGNNNSDCRRKTTHLRKALDHKSLPIRKIFSEIFVFAYIFV